MVENSCQFLKYNFCYDTTKLKKVLCAHLDPFCWPGHHCYLLKFLLQTEAAQYTCCIVMHVLVHVQYHMAKTFKSYNYLLVPNI